MRLKMENPNSRVKEAKNFYKKIGGKENA